MSVTQQDTLCEGQWTQSIPLTLGYCKVDATSAHGPLEPNGHMSSVNRACQRNKRTKEISGGGGGKSSEGSSDIEMKIGLFLFFFYPDNDAGASGNSPHTQHNYFTDLTQEGLEDLLAMPFSLAVGH